MISTMDALGASATAIAYSELYTSLQSGVVDAAENGVTSYMSNSFNEVAPYFITDAHTFGCGVILMNADKWNGFNDAEKGWIKEAALAARSACYEYNQKQEQACFDSFADKGITKLEVPISKSGRRPAHLCMKSRAPTLRTSSLRPGRQLLIPAETF